MSIKKQKQDVRLLVVFSDLHSGSRRALMPPKYTLYEEGKLEQIIMANKQQLWLWDCWQIAWDRVLKYVGNDKWGWVFNGDAVDGTRFNSESLSSDLTDHQLIFHQLCEPAAALAAKRFFVRGTRVHTGDTVEMKLAEKLGCEQHPDTGQHAADRWMINVNGFNVLFRHHMSVTTREHARGTALTNEFCNEVASATLRSQPIPNGVCFAHRHGYDYWDGGHNFALVSGPWQQTTRYGHVKWSSMVPAPTITVLDWRGKEKGAAPRVENFIFEPKAASVTKL